MATSTRTSIVRKRFINAMQAVADAHSRIRSTKIAMKRAFTKSTVADSMVAAATVKQAASTDAVRAVAAETAVNVTHGTRTDDETAAATALDTAREALDTAREALDTAMAEEVYAATVLDAVTTDLANATAEVAAPTATLEHAIANDEEQWSIIAVQLFPGLKIISEAIIAREALKVVTFTAEEAHAEAVHTLAVTALTAAIAEEATATATHTTAAEALTAGTAAATAETDQRNFEMATANAAAAATAYAIAVQKWRDAQTALENANADLAAAKADIHSTYNRHII